MKKKLYIFVFIRYVPFSASIYFECFCFRQPNVQTLANLLDEVIKVNSRFEPYLAKCRDLIRNDAVMTPSVSVIHCKKNS